MIAWRGVMRRFCLLLFIALFSIVGCQKNTSPTNTIKVGTIAGPETELMEVAKKVAAEKYHLNIDIIEFNDYTLPNTALNDGSIDANMFQHLPYLEASITAHKYQLTSIGKTFIYPMGAYSNKIKSIQQLRENAVVAIPNDPSNSARALLLLNKVGIIELRPGVTTQAITTDIINNPKHIEIREIDAAQLPRILPDVDLAIINSNYAVPSGLYPFRDALFIEGTDSEYANIVVVRTKDKDDARYVYLMKALHSPEVVAKAKELFKLQAIPAWDLNN